ncbi:MAG: hypothetical protein ABSC55_06005 [Syntrophorhabdales bacterium]|jgi:hypothetical protein
MRVQRKERYVADPIPDNVPERIDTLNMVSWQSGFVTPGRVSLRPKGCFSHCRKAPRPQGLGCFFLAPSYGPSKAALDPEAPGCCFVIELAITGIAEVDHG